MEAHDHTCAECGALIGVGCTANDLREAEWCETCAEEACAEAARRYAARMRRAMMDSDLRSRKPGTGRVLPPYTSDDALLDRSALWRQLTWEIWKHRLLSLGAWLVLALGVVGLAALVQLVVEEIAR